MELSRAASQIFTLSYVLFHQTLLHPPSEFMCTLQIFVLTDYFFLLFQALSDRFLY
jgi:hypothetical protein